MLTDNFLLGITDLHALRYTNSAPFARHKFMNMLTHSKSILDEMLATNLGGRSCDLQRMGKKSQTMWMSRHGQQLAAALIFLLFLSSHCLPSFCAFPLEIPLVVWHCCSEVHKCTYFLTVQLDFKQVCEFCHKYAHYACSIWIIHANLGLRAYKCDKHVLVVCAKHKGQ